MPDNILYDVTVDGGKYRFVYFADARPPMAYRHGEAWDPRIASMVGDKALMSLVGELHDLRAATTSLIRNASINPLTEAGQAAYAELKSSLDIPELISKPGSLGRVKLTPRGVSRVLKGEVGMIFDVERWGGVDDKTAMVLDRRYPNAGAAGGYQCGSLGEGDYEIVDENAPATAAQLTIQVSVTFERIADMMVGAVEGGSGYWCNGFYPAPDDHSQTLKRAIDLAGNGPWYSVDSYWRDGGKAALRYDPPTDSDNGARVIGTAEIFEGLNKMAAQAPQHFADLVNENDDAITADVFLQMILFGEIVFG